MNLKFVAVIVLVLSSCTNNQKITPTTLIPVDSKNSIFDLNKNGYLDPNESNLYMYYQQSDYVTNEVIDIDHDDYNSAEETKLIIDFLQSQPESEQNEMLQKFLKIPGISIESNESLGKVRLKIVEKK